MILALPLPSTAYHDRCYRDQRVLGLVECHAHGGRRPEVKRHDEAGASDAMSAAIRMDMELA